MKLPPKEIRQPEKAAALIAQLQKSVRQFDDPSVTDAERAEVIKKMPKDRERTAAEVFKSGLATRNEMNMLFATMAQDAGLDARPARVADWNEVFFNPKNSNVSYMIRTDNVAVKTGADGWSIYDVSQRYLPPGALPWRHEGVFALVTDPKTPVFVQTPVSHAEASTTARTGKFTLTTDGTLEGDVEESVTGHRAEDRRSQLADQSESQRTEWLETRVRNMFPQSEVSKESWSDVEDPAKPLVIKYHVKAPHFAQITGRRILFHVNPLARSQGSPFTASLRRNPVQFPYAWKDQDRISIQLPDGFALDNADNPGDFGLGENGSYKLSIQIAKATNELKVSRDFSFGKIGRARV